jgi:hypothetical protein
MQLRTEIGPPAGHHIRSLSFKVNKHSNLWYLSI